jgi:glycosyltransferase involved in cell wall biosynthesis
MTHWCEALQQIETAQISVVQRFSRNEFFTQNGVKYYFIKDKHRPDLLPWQIPIEALTTVVEARPDIVHTGGPPYCFPMLRRLLPASTPIVWQHHGGGFPGLFTRFLYRSGFNHVNTFLFTAKEQAEPWIHHSLIHSQPVIEVLEGSTMLSPFSYEQSRRTLGITATPTFLWVGHLNANKDPLTVIKGFSLSLRSMPDAQLFLAYGSNELLPDVKLFIKNNNLNKNVHLLGVLCQKDLQLWYSASDYFVLGSHSEGSGYALMESLACGATPIVTNIPSFRRITGNGKFGSLWAPGKPESLQSAIYETIKKPSQRHEIRTYFEENLSFPAIALTAFNTYVNIVRDTTELLKQ